MKTFIGLLLIFTAFIGLISIVKKTIDLFGRLFKKSTQNDTHTVCRLTRLDELKFWLMKHRAGKPALRKRRWFKRKRPQAVFC